MEAVGQQQVVAEAGGDEDLLDALQAAHLAQQFHLRVVVHLQHRAERGGQAAAGRADAAGELLGAFEAVHVGGRAAQVVDIAFEFGDVGELAGFRQDRLRAAPAHGAPFVDGDGAEVALAVAAAVGGDRKADRLQRLDLAAALVIGMLGALEIEGVDRIQLGLGLVGRGGFCTR